MARGYGAFTVDESSFDRVFQYIKEQKEHHAGLSSLKVRRLVSNSFQDSVSNHKLSNYESEIQKYKNKYGFDFKEFESKFSNIVEISIIEKEDDFMEWEGLSHSFNSLQGSGRSKDIEYLIMDLASSKATREDAMSHFYCIY